ncbi:TPA: hypothetical protein SMS53_001198 [Proteus mirabilis]|nr:MULTISPECIES: hypothetical protein [Proteus]AZF93083.1 MAG: hypothetical protein [Phage NV21]EMA1120482.1 hypothetical protein [Proteus mirabilis]MBI6518402.1 hypothetical protein [Proteus mirabilis]MCT0089495.1 hypothetical protein [Proteus mirabilis]RLZ22001.1 hypothetical protein EA137_14265 [Proteus mirabilis]
MLIIMKLITILGLMILIYAVIAMINGDTSFLVILSSIFGFFASIVPVFLKKKEKPSSTRIKQISGNDSININSGRDTKL